MSTIQVLGIGCSRCGHLLVNAQRATQAAGRTDTVERVTDFVRILDFTPAALPALAIDGKVVTAGSIPTPAQIQVLLATAEDGSLRLVRKSPGSQIT